MHTSIEHAVALAAKFYSVPVICIAGLYKLSPMYPREQDTMAAMGSSHAVLQNDEVPLGAHRSLLDVINPTLDYVPPELVDILVTNHSVIPSNSDSAGGHQSSYIYRLLSEYYCPEDRTLN